ncbi:MAG: PTS sugar transporter subunit IIA [Bdellovibrionales bacterium]|jgi:PTS system nitrogen regulatory IIA component
MKKDVALNDLLGLDAVVAACEAETKKQLLENLAAHAGTALALEAHVLFDALWEREKLGTTGVGQGIAIPHARIAGLDKVQGFFVQLKTPLSFDAVDDQPVDLVFLLLAPQDAGADHLHALACVSKILRNSDFCAKLRKAKDEKALTQILESAVNMCAA